MNRWSATPRFVGSRSGSASWSAFSAVRPWRWKSSRRLSPRHSQKTELAARVAAEGRFPMKTIANVLGVARSHLHERVHRPTAARGSYCKAADEKLLPLIRRLVDERPTYGYRRVTQTHTGSQIGRASCRERA